MPPSISVYFFFKRILRKKKKIAFIKKNWANVTLQQSQCTPSSHLKNIDLCLIFWYTMITRGIL